jgi:hypothetical protein
MGEILFEILLAIAQMLAEAALEILFEGLAEFGIRRSRDYRQKPVRPAWAFAGHMLLGAIAGLISILFVPHALIRSPAWRIANLVITPLLAGGLMSALGAWRVKRGQDKIRLDRFGYAFLFALSMAVVRFFGTN